MLTKDKWDVIMGFEEHIVLIKIIAALIATVVYINNKR